ncbi:protein NUCLEAR FUSION DEFECTIVE 4 isoform X2 [Cryptomeria japonica]|uniref:protein NUCLEAR FUSION DEFECTIVE 4 isoform X2 n=1 Tax=Cryptomeria japonica TaxID=3369 RepID=UPI0025AD8936|nr:protein NUCLEAR FUSION DEFECTIVE 4 isoform X2 [Cryptomeria japonica]
MGIDSVQNRWMVLVACMWIECCAGPSFGFSIYSQAIKTRFGYNQQQLDTISVYSSLGVFGGILSGLLNQCLPAWLVLLIGSLLNLAGYTIVWLFVSGRLPVPPLWELGLFTCIALSGSLYFNTVSLVTSVNSFPDNRGLVVGLMKGCLGLSSAILSTVWKVLFPDSDGSDYLLVGAIVPSVVAFLLMPIVKKCEPDDCKNGSSRTMQNLALAAAPMVFLAVFFMASSFWDGHSLQGDRVKLVVTLITIAIPLYVAWKASTNERTSIGNKTVLVPLTTQEDSNNFDKYVIIECADSSLWRTICSINFFLVLFSSAVAIESGGVTINNMNQIATSLGYAQQDITIFVTLISASQFLGRFGSGALSDYLLSNFGVARPILVALAQLILCCGYMLIIIAGTFPQALYLGCIFIGFSFGTNWCLSSITISDLFGLHHFGTLYNVMMMGNPIVLYVLSVWVAGYLYDIEAAKQGGGQCKGSTCFNLTFIILFSISMFATLASFVLWWRTRYIYRKRMDN